MFQVFSNDLMMLIGNLMQWKFRMPSVMKKMLRNMTEKTIHDIMTKTDWKDDSVHKTCIAIRKYQHALGYSENWMTEYVYNIVLLAKKEPKPKENTHFANYYSCHYSFAVGTNPSICPYGKGTYFDIAS